MSKDFSNFLGQKKSKNIDLLGSKKKTQKDKLKTNLGQSADKQNPSRRVLRPPKENVEITQRKRSDKGGENVEITQRKRRDSVEVSSNSKKERSDKGGENVEITQRKRSDKGGENVEIKPSPEMTDPTLLVGTQRKVFSYLIQVSKNYASLDTPMLTLDAISLATGLKKSQIHSATKELRKKRCIFIKSRKDGRGGWVIYSLYNSAFEKWNRLNSVQERSENVEITQRKRSGKGGYKGGYSSHSSSYNFNLENTTTTVNNLLLEKCAYVEVPAEVLKIGFKESHLKQIFTDSSLSKEEVAESLDHYALDLRNGSVRAGFGKLNMIVGVLKKSNQYVSEAYISEEQKMLEELRKRSEKLKELKEKKSEIALLKKYKEWKVKLTQEDINKFVPPSNIIEEGGTLQDIQLQSYFEEIYK